MNRSIHTINDFANLIYKMLKSDRDVNLACGGFTGVGKSTFTAKLQKEYSRISGTHWDFDRMTWDRSELMKWIDGEGEYKEGQLPEYSAILADELFLLFFNRNWYDREQIDSISVFNMCRDRHLFIAGNVPNFWEIDPSFRERIRFYAYLPERGKAWIFEQEDNPFSKDPWNVNENQKLFRRYKHPYKCPNFLFEVHFDDFDATEKERYLEIRNKKRVKAIDDRKARQEAKNMTRNDILIGKAILSLSKYSNFSITKVAEKILGIHRQTAQRYVKLYRADNSINGYVNVDDGEDDENDDDDDD